MRCDLQDRLVTTAEAVCGNRLERNGSIPPLPWTIRGHPRPLHPRTLCTEYTTTLYKQTPFHCIFVPLGYRVYRWHYPICMPHTASLSSYQAYHAYRDTSLCHRPIRARVAESCRLCMLCMHLFIFFDTTLPIDTRKAGPQDARIASLLPGRNTRSLVGPCPMPHALAGVLVSVLRAHLCASQGCWDGGLLEWK